MEYKEKKDYKESIDIIKNQWLKSSLYSNLDFLAIEDYLTNWTKLTKLIREINKNNWIRLLFDTNTRISKAQNNEKSIILWLQKVPDHIKKQWWINEYADDSYMKKYVFSHENCHHIVFCMEDHQSEFSEYARLKRILKSSRNLWYGFSWLWSMEFYETTWQQRVENCVELLNRYIMSPEDCKSYLHYLVNTDIDILKDKWLMSLQNTVTADKIFEIIGLCVWQLLQKYWKIDRIR